MSKQASNKKEEPPSTRPASSAVLWAAWRAGLKDLQRAVLTPFPGQSMESVSEPGSIANPTNYEVHQEKHPKKQEKGKGKESEPEPEMERE